MSASTFQANQEYSNVLPTVLEGYTKALNEHESLRRRIRILEEAEGAEQRRMKTSNTTTLPLGDTQNTQANMDLFGTYLSNAQAEYNRVQEELLVAECKHHAREKENIYLNENLETARLENLALSVKLQDASNVRIEVETHLTSLQHEFAALQLQVTQLDSTSSSGGNDVEELKQLLAQERSANAELKRENTHLRENAKGITARLQAATTTLHKRSTSISSLNKIAKHEALPENKPVNAQVTTTPKSTTSKTSPIRTPDNRLAPLKSLPVLTPKAPEEHLRTGFGRKFLASHLGGNVQSLIVKITDSQKSIAKMRHLTQYLCVNEEHNPWCPAEPGEHGYMFVGLGRERDTFLMEETWPLFVRSNGGGKQNKEFVYLGIYKVIRVDPLTVDEWGTLPDDFKLAYRQTTKDKEKFGGPVTEIQHQYDTGIRSVPCVRLQCIDFDDTLLKYLVDAIAIGKLTSKADRTSLTISHGRKRRLSTDDGNGRHRRTFSAA